MAVVTYDDCSFMVDGSRIWLVSGSVHYFRVPAGLWRDRLLKAKRAGLNCISTYVAWNFHEPQEGNWRLSGDHDVAEFVRIAGELGLYVILRPGPYICAEWDFGGLPAWLTAKTGIAYRTNNAAYMHYFDKYFRQVLPPLAELQVSRGGNIILIQNENEYRFTTMPDRLRYLEFINQLFRRSGFDIPIINCNGFSEPPVEGTVECVNGWDGVVQAIKRMRCRQGDAPLLVTEFWPGWFDQWGGEHSTRDDCEAARRAMEIIGCGAQINYYMWHGGTNFAFWGSRLGTSDGSYQTTSYDYDAPLAEGGGLTRKYYLTKLVNMLASHMGRFFATSKMPTPPVSIHDGTDVMNLAGPQGNWAIVTNNGQSQTTKAEISLPDGRELEVSLAPFGATAVPVGLRLDQAHKLDYANLMPLGLFGEKTMVLHGPAGWAGRVCINGRELTDTVPAGDEVKLLEHQEMLVVLINSELAMRTWFVGDELIFGPGYVGESTEEIFHSPGSKEYAVLSAEGKITRKKVRPSAQRRPAAPRLGNWRRLCVCNEPSAKDLAWSKMDRPRHVDRLGAPYGYEWYRIEMDEQRARKRYLFLPDCEDRATLYLNGSMLGVWGRGPGAKRELIPATVKRGRNVLTLLVDNLGRSNFGSRLGELKGLFGHVYDAKLLRGKKFKLHTGGTFSKRLVPRQLAHMVEELERATMWTAEMTVQMTKVTPVHLSFVNIPHHVAVLCNEAVVGFFPAEGAMNFGDVTLSSGLKKGSNRIKLLLWGQVEAKVLDNVSLHLLKEVLSQGASWSSRPWTVPSEPGPVVGKDQPAWYVTKFKCAQRPDPLFLHVVGAKKGQLFLNGYNIGRFWTVGPQQYYYLPECWLGEENVLLMFEEHGHIPARSRLEYRPLGPYHQ